VGLVANTMVLKDIRTFITQNLTPYANIDIDLLPTSGEAIILRNDPANSKPTTYFDKSSIGIINFSIYARSKNGNTAYEQVEAIVKLLDIPRGINITDDKKLFIKCEQVSSITLIDQSEQGEYTYYAALTFEYSRQK
jgi:hypothetical protein